MEAVITQERRQPMERRLDSLERQVHGEKDLPGLTTRMAVVERVIFGKDQNQQEGMLYKVSLMWKAHLWILCLLSGAVGFGLRELIRTVWKV